MPLNVFNLDFGTQDLKAKLTCLHQKTLDSLLKKVEETSTVRNTRAFSKNDMDKLSQSYSNLFNIKDKTSVADAPESTVTAKNVWIQ